MRWARSAHTRPTRTAVSKEVSFPLRAAEAAARSRWIFCCGVSPAGALPKSIWVPGMGALELKDVELAA